ncbi:MAG: hypothetical protein CL927_01985 [Deltaproteobacteria bacterium]|nr:hypothetical protein [Deltaproteobacteria bacterium]
MLMLLLSAVVHATPTIIEVPPGQVAPPGAAPLFRPAPRRAPKAFSALGLDRLHRIESGMVPTHFRAWTDPRGWPMATPSDPYLSWQWGLSNDGSFSEDAQAGADIQAFDAWDIETGSGVVIAVLDSGIAVDEPELSSLLWTNRGEIAGNRIDDDGNGYVDDVLGWNFAGNDASPTDHSGHGSNVTGIAAAQGNNGTGFSGVCWGCEVMTLRVLNNQDYGYYSWWSAAVVYAVDNGADVINMSLGGYTEDIPLCLALEYAEAAGVPVVVSMGNSDDDTPAVPASCATAIAVGATDVSDARATPFDWGGGSAYGDHIFLSAPGSVIYSLDRNPGDYRWYWSGTSQAAPHVTGLIALLKSMEPSLDADELRYYLSAGAEDEVGDPAEDTPGWDAYHGHGRINAYQSLLLLEADQADADEDGYSILNGDCDDTNPDIAPDAVERCDELDSDCDGSLLDGFSDRDEDGRPDCLDDLDGDGVDARTDCDDTDPNVSPDAEEIPYDSIDNDCDPSSLDDDLDEDGFSIALDCDDDDPERSPSAIERCDGVDNDCDAEIDEDAVDGVVLYAAPDGDGYGDPSQSRRGCAPDADWVEDASDCDSTDPAVQASSTWYPDFDGDGQGDPAHPLSHCGQPADYVANNADCDDQRVGPCDPKGGCSTVESQGVQLLGWAALLAVCARRRQTER